MAVSTNAATTYTMSNKNREDLIDMITNISPRKTPILSMSSSTRATGRYHEWLIDNLASPTANAQIEGNEATARAITAPTRDGNYCQILDKIFTISETQQEVDKAGPDSEVDYQTQKHMAELATDIEYAYVVNTASVSGASATARQMKGLAGFISDNQSTATASRALTSTLLDDVLQLAWADGGDPDIILCGGFQKRKIATFTENTRDIAAEAAKIVNTVDVYQSSFGVLRVVLSHVMNTNLAGQVFTLDMTYIRKAWLRPIKRTELSKDGDYRKFQIVAETTIEVLNEKAHGTVKNLTTS